MALASWITETLIYLRTSRDLHGFSMKAKDFPNYKAIPN